MSIIIKIYQYLLVILSLGLLTPGGSALANATFATLYSVEESAFSATPAVIEIQNLTELVPGMFAEATITFDTTLPFRVFSEITITAVTAGEHWNDTAIYFTDSTDLGSGIFAVHSYSNSLGDDFVGISVDDDTSIELSDLAAKIDALPEFQAVFTSILGDGQFNAPEDTDPSITNLSGGKSPIFGISEDVLFQLGSTAGAEQFFFGAGTSLAQLIDGINLVSHLTGVVASNNAEFGSHLEFASIAEGNQAFVDIQILKEGNGTSNQGDFTTAFGSGVRAYGTSIPEPSNQVLIMTVIVQYLICRGAFQHQPN